MREYIGNIGHLAIIISFVTSIISTIAYFLAAQSENKNPEEAKSWKQFARITFTIHGLSVFTIVFALFNIIYNHYYPTKIWRSLKGRILHLRIMELLILTIFFN